MESRVKTRFSLLFQQVLGLTGIVKRLVFYHGMHLSSLLNNGSAGESRPNWMIKIVDVNTEAGKRSCRVTERYITIIGANSLIISELY